MDRDVKIQSHQNQNFSDITGSAVSIKSFNYEKIYSEEYLRPRFRNFYHDHPSTGIKDFDFGKSEVGVGNKLSTYSIRKILGLSMYGQFRGASRGVKNKMVGGISKLLDRNLGTLP